MEFTQYIDLAQVTLYLFWIFFFCLIYWLRKEDRREGYPLESDNPKRVGSTSNLLFPAPKTFALPEGGTYTAPNFERDERPIDGERTSVAKGSSMEPVGDPMLSGIGPASYAERDDHPEKTRHGDNLISPMRVATEYWVSAGPDVRGWDVVGADGEVAGQVVDIWVDKADLMVRYLEVQLGEGAEAEAEPAEAREPQADDEADDEADDDAAAHEDADDDGEDDASDGDDADDEETEKKASAEAAPADDDGEGEDEEEEEQEEDDEEAEGSSDDADEDEEQDEDEEASGDEDEAEEEAPAAAAPIEAPENTRLVPIQVALVRKESRTVEVSAIYGAQFAKVPTLKNPNEVTLLEEEKISAFYAGGRLYADETRREPKV